jgi:flagellar hook-basal body complex protein FliE
MRIIPLSPGISKDLGKTIGSAPKTSSDSFVGLLKSKIQEVNQLQNASDETMAEGSVQGAKNIHESMIKVEEADISLRLLTKVRNKALDAYQEIMRMQF